MSDDIPIRHSIGQVVEANIVSAHPFGVFAVLDDGTPAYIRCREMSLDGDEDPRTLVSTNQRVHAKVLELSRNGRRMEISMRAVLPDPWREFSRRHKMGDTVRGTVTRIRSHGVTVRVAEGIKGFVPLRELATWPVGKPEELLSLGDHVEGTIILLDATHKSLRLSIRRRLGELSRVDDVMRLIHQETDAEQVEEAAGDEDESAPGADAAGLGMGELPDLSAVGPILVVEDNLDVREPLSQWLGQRGCAAQGAKSCQEAREKLAETEFGTAIVDIELEGPGNGLELIQCLREDGHQVQVAVMSTLERIEQHLDTLQDYGVIAVFPKPLDLDYIEEVLEQLADGEVPALELEPSAETGDRDQMPFAQIAASARSGGSVEERFVAGLGELLEQTHGSAAIVFSLKADPRKPVSVVAHVDQPWQGQWVARRRQELDADRINDLLHSPVRDVIVERQGFMENRVSHKVGRFEKLLNFVQFGSCIAEPISADGRTEHALFLLHDQGDAFSQVDWSAAWAVARLFGVILESQALDERVQSVGRILLSGQLAAALRHEVFNRVTGLDLRLANLQTGLDTLFRDGSIDRESRERFRHDVDAAVETATDLNKLALDYRRLMHDEPDQLVDVNEVVRDARSTVLPLASRAKVRIELYLDDGLPPVRCSRASLQQVVSNLMLNAIQQMDERPEGCRRLLEVSSELTRCKDRPCIHIACADTGPGIHRNLWESIFEFGFTTRVDGSGLGLYIARTLVESMGGRVVLESSTMLLGSRFVIGLPSAIPSRPNQ